jgi:hypothetical protein
MPFYSGPLMHFLSGVDTTDRDLQNLGCVQAEIATDLGSAATGSGGRACERANKTT